jgi:Icc-related predicted phosphoesterase
MAAHHRPLRIAAVGDIHCDETSCEHVADTFARMGEAADLVLLAGDLTTYGEPEQARLIADAVKDLDVPVIAVLGNHDLHANRGDELVEALATGGIRVLEGEHATLELAGRSIGVAGAKGFVGGFPGSYLPDFGEPLLRKVYAETSLAVHGIDEGLRAVAACDVRIVLLHYSPAAATLEGEPPGIMAFLGSDRLALPIAEHRPDLVLHGHAHAGRFLGHIAEVPVYNVSVPVLGRDFWLFEIGGEEGASLHGDEEPGAVAGRI